MMRFLFAIKNLRKTIRQALGNAIKSHAGKDVYAMLIEKLRKGFVNLQENQDKKQHDQFIKIYR